jgi:uroporphyrinogen-III synthase
MTVAGRLHGLSSLHGARVAVTRPWQDDDALVAALRAAGASPVVVPLIGIEPASDGGPLAAAAAELVTFDWAVFTSATAVRFLAEAASPAESGQRPRRVAAVGDATAAAVRRILGWEVDVVPSRFTGDDVPAAMAAVAPLHGARVIWPRAEGARDAVARSLEEAGAMLSAPVAYRSVELPANARMVARMLARGELHVVTLTSPSAVRCLAAATPDFGSAVVAVIGPVTADAARECGIPVHVEPPVQTIPALVRELELKLAAGAGDVEGA